MHTTIKNLLLLTVYMVGIIYSCPQFYTQETDTKSKSHLAGVYIQSNSQGIFADPKPVQGWQQDVFNIFNSRPRFVAFDASRTTGESLKTYARSNDELQFNDPLICFKFPLTEHTSEG